MRLAFSLLFFIVPLIFFPKNSEVFELNKMMGVYLITLIILSLWVIKMILERRVIFRRTIIGIPLLIFILTQGVASYFSIDQRVSIFGYYSRFNGGFLSLISYSLLYFAYVSNLTMNDTRKVIKVMLVSTLVVSIWGILEHFGASPSCLIIRGQLNTDCWVQDVKNRVFATFGQPNWMAAWVSAISPLAWAMTFNSKNKNLRKKRFLIWVIVSVIFFAALLFTKSRSGLLGFAAASLVFWFLSRRLKIFLVLNSLFLIFILLIGTPWTPSLITKRVAYLPTSPELTITESSDIRKIVWKGAVLVWKHHPLVGTGPETFAFSYFQFRPIEHNLTSEWNFIYNKAHNEYLNYAANTGTVGLIAYVILIVFSIYQIVSRFLKFDSWRFGILAGFVSLLVTNFFGFSVVATNLLFFIFPAMAVTLVEGDKYQVLSIKKLNLQRLQKLFIVLLVLATAYFIQATVKYWYADYLYAQGENFYEERNYEKAVERLKKATNLTFREGLYHSKLASIYASYALDNGEAKNKESLIALADQEAKAAESLSPRNIKILQEIVNTYSDLGEIDEVYFWRSLEVLNRLTVLAPTDARIFYITGITYLKVGEYEQGIKMLEKAVVLKSDYEKAKSLLEALKMI